MTHLKIELNNIPENVTTNTIEKLYSTVTANDYVYDDDDLKGTLLTTSAYEDIVQYLETKYPGLHINATKLYVRFLDLEVKRVLLANGYGDGTGITRTELATITTLPNNLFYGNTTVTSLNDLLKFTGLTNINGTFAQNCPNLTSVTLPSSITGVGNTYYNLGEGVFSGCSSLQNVTLNEGLTTMGYRMFRNCTSLTTINIPSTVTALGLNSNTGSTFEGCTGLTTVTGSCILSTLGPYSFNDCNQLESIGDIDISNVSTIPYRAFYACNKLNFGNKLANMPNLTTVGGNAFEGCWLLSNIDLSHVTNITNTYAFRNCSALTSVDLSSLSSLPNSTFEGCTGLTTVTGGSSLTSIGNFGFGNCSNLSSIDLSNVTSIGSYAFYNCTNLSNIDFSNITNFGGAAFLGCTSLGVNTDLDFDLDGKTFGSNVFRSTGYTTVTLHETTKHQISGFSGSGEYDAFGALMPNLIKFDLSDTKLTNVGSLYSNNLTTLILPETYTGGASKGRDWGTSLLYIICLQLNPASVTKPNSYWGFAYMPANCAIYVPDSVYLNYVDAWVTNSNDPIPSSRIKPISELPSSVTWYTKEHPSS